MSLNNTLLDHGKFTLGIGAEDSRTLTGANMVRFFEADGDFEISLDGGRFVPMTKGKRLMATAGDRVRTLKIKNTSGVENTIRYYYGVVDIADDTLQVVGAAELIWSRPDGAENLYDSTVNTTATTIVESNSSTAEILAYNSGAENVQILNAADELIDVLEAGKKERYRVTAGLKAKTLASTSTLLVSRFFF